MEHPIRVWADIHPVCIWGRTAAGSPLHANHIFSQKTSSSPIVGVHISLNMRWPLTTTKFIVLKCAIEEPLVAILELQVKSFAVCKRKLFQAFKNFL